MRALMFTVAALALAACGPTTTPTEAPEAETPAAEQAAPTTREAATAQDTCGASQYRAMVGSQLAAVTFPSDAGIRIIQPDTVVTQDFRADRLNVIVDANGVITGLECY
ncbi:MAG TPA: I78 family peptidase inhibitor [Vitreimonas sp.]|uniref:I78 family peptidase inhibitor n=1 Tax=Vitreimonas sp. TaxID=3069702 RepID=UPI002D377A6F|nr:I78 family peptidase inhibitor [Vitreimonas sp.]HYD85952.1 I78 family peptidase inhibitor [Vitreimonas sp.]